MPPAARVTDMHTCPMVTGVVPHVGGPITPPGCPTVFVGMLPAARVGDMVTCAGPPDTIVRGSPTVYIGNMPAARMGDNTAHGGVITIGHPTTYIGDTGNAGGGGGGTAAPAVSAQVSVTSEATATTAAAAASSAAASGAGVSKAAASAAIEAVRAANRAAAQTGKALCEVCNQQDMEGLAAVPAPGEMLAPSDLDAEMAAAPIEEEAIGSAEPECSSALEEKEAVQKRAEGMPPRNGE